MSQKRQPGRKMLNPRVQGMKDYTLRRTDVNDAEARALSLRREPIIDGRLGNTIKFGLGTYPPYKEALAAAAMDDSSHSYTNAKGLPALNEMLAEGNLEFGVKGYCIDPERVFVGAGISGLARSLFDVIINPFGKDNVVIPAWSYIVYFAEAARTGSAIINAGLCKDGQVDLDDLRRKINRDTKAVIVTTVGNPLGVAMEPMVLHRIMEIVNEMEGRFRHPISLVVDRIYEDFRTCGEPLDPIGMAIAGGREGPLIDMYSISKMIAAPGDRLGWMRVYHDGKKYAAEVAALVEGLTRLVQPPLGQTATLQQEALRRVFAGFSDEAKRRHYDAFREQRRDECIRRMRGFLSEASVIPDIVFPEYCYGEDGKADPKRLHTFYVLVGVVKELRPRGGMTLARELAEFCIDNPRMPVPLGTPGDNFLEAGLRNAPQEYMRFVALFNDTQRGMVVEALRRFVESKRR